MTTNNSHQSDNNFKYLFAVASVFLTNDMVTSFEVTETEPTQQDSFDKIKERTKLSTKGKSPYGPQRK